MKILQDELKLKIEYMGEERELQGLVKQVHSFIVDYMETSQIIVCLRTAHYAPTEEIDEQIWTKG